MPFHLHPHLPRTHPHLSIEGKIFISLPWIFYHRPHPLPSHRPRVAYQWGPGSRCYNSSPRAQNGRPSRWEGHRAAPNRTCGLRPTFCSRLPRVGERQIVSAPFAFSAYTHTHAPSLRSNGAQEDRHVVTAGPRAPLIHDARAMTRRWMRTVEKYQRKANEDLSTFASRR